MLDAYNSGQDWAVPNVRHYTTLLYAWQQAKSIDGPIRCEEILKSMHALSESHLLPGCKPDSFAYTSVLHCWSDSGRPDAPQRAEALFRQMKQLYEDGDEGVKPDNIAYSNLINAIAKSDGFAHAEDLLWEMVDDYINGNDKCKPRIRNLNTILAVWSKSPVPYAAEKAEAIVQRWLTAMEVTKLDVAPDNYTYCLLLKCWYVQPCIHCRFCPLLISHSRTHPPI